MAEEKPPEKFTDHMPALIAAAAVTVGVSFLGSYLGTAGTIGGLALGSLLSGTGSWYGERGLRLAAAKAKARREAARAKGKPLTATETGLIDMRVEREHRRVPKRMALAAAASVSGIALLAGFLVISATAGAAGRPVSDIVRGRPAPAATSTRQALPSANAPPSSSTAPVLPSNTPDAAPTPAPAAKTPSPSPDAAPVTEPAGSGSPATSTPASASRTIAVNPGSYCSTAGASGITETGRAEVCRASATDSRLRWREP